MEVFKIVGEDASGWSGYRVSGAGDVNGDGYDDVIIGAYLAGDAEEGKNYVVFGKGSGFSDIDLGSLGSKGFKIVGEGENASNIGLVSGAGDVNGDGYDDIIVSGAGAEESGDTNEGISYVLFGKASGFVDVDLGNEDSFTSETGFKIIGEDNSDNSGWSASGAGDMNGDGYDDLIVGAYLAEETSDGEGISYVIYGGNFLSNVVVGSGVISGTTEAESIVGSNGADRIDTMGGADSVRAGGGDDIVEVTGTEFLRVDGGSGFDTLKLGGTGLNIRLRDLLGAEDMEVIDLTGSGNNRLRIEKSFFLSSFSGFKEGGKIKLVIEGNAGDSIQLSRRWVVNKITYNGGEYQLFEDGNYQLIVNTAVSLVPRSTNDINLRNDDSFKLIGEDREDYSGRSVSDAGDVNGDGYDDIIVGARGAEDGETGQGISYVIFGSGNGFRDMDLGDLGANTGFRIIGEDVNDNSGYSVSGIGDLNGDGYDDIIVGARDAEAGGNTTQGISYVVYGKGSGFGDIRLSHLSVAEAGFRIFGEDSDDRSGESVSGAGDINGDGYADFIIGARSAGSNNQGISYVIFGGGKNLLNVSLSELDSSIGFKIFGEDDNDYFGHSVSGAGDVNGDGYDDIIVGANGAESGRDEQGISYVIFGKEDGFGDIDLGDSNSFSVDVGFRILGEDSDDDSGIVSSAGDVNGDGYDDVIIGAYNAEEGRDDQGISYVVFGKASFVGDVDLGDLTSSTGFKILGDSYDDSGSSVSGAGDVNGDGYADLLVGSYHDGATQRGISYVVFGKASGFGDVDLKNLGSNGFKISGEDYDDRTGVDVSGAGDINGDGYDDIVIGGGWAERGSTSDQGISYVIYGRDFSAGGDVIYGSGMISGTRGANNIVGSKGADTIATMGGADSVNAGAGDDMIRVTGTEFFRVDGGSGYDSLIFGGAGLNMELSDLWRVEDIEAIDLTGGSGDNHLAVTEISYLSSLVGLREDGKIKLVIEGDAGDSIEISGRWLASTVVDNGTNYNVFQQGNYEITVNTLVEVQGTWQDILDLGDLGSEGFKIVGEDREDHSGRSVSSVGDVNGDGYDDVIIGANAAESGRNLQGISYVVFGKASGLDDVDLENLGNGGFRILGENSLDASGGSVSSAGDVNGDGFDDVLIGAAEASQGDGEGTSYVVYGASSRSVDVDLRSLGTNGFKIIGESHENYSGSSVSSAGDVNGDGYDDIIIGATHAESGRADQGISYVVFGSGAGFVDIELRYLGGNEGFKILGEDVEDRSGKSVSGVGDVNGDGYDDIIVGASRAEDGSEISQGISYVIFGKGSEFSDLDLRDLRDDLNTDIGFKIVGEDGGDGSGFSVSGAGDVNGDGYDDIIVGAQTAEESSNNQGISYVIFGKGSEFSNIDLGSLGSGEGFKILGEDGEDYSGVSVSGAGDVNGDGYDDIIVGATGAEEGSNAESQGISYVIFGKGNGFSDIDLWDIESFSLDMGFKILGEDGDDSSGTSVSGAGDINGDGYDDIIIGADDAEDGSEMNQGISYVIYGRDFSGAVTVGSGTFSGTVDVDNLVGSSGADVINTLGGADSVNAGAGDDTITVTGTDFFYVDGGSGFDTLNLMLSGLEIELAELLRAENIEAIDLTGSGNNQLNIEEALLLNKLVSYRADGKLRLVIEGNAGDSVKVDKTWFSGTTNYKSTTYTLLEKDNYELVVSPNVEVKYDTNDVALSKLLGVGFKISGEDREDKSGISVSKAGDMNGDGYEDIIVGARDAEQGNSSQGISYVIFGKGGSFRNLDLSSLNSQVGFKIIGKDGGDWSGYSVSGAGDVNADGYADVIIGAYNAEENSNDNEEGISYVVFGKENPSDVNLGSLGNNGFKIIGEDRADYSGYSVSGAGDVNGDGYDDVIIGAYQAEEGEQTQGISYVVFGKARGFGNVDLGNLGSKGFRIIGESQTDSSGYSVSGAGDVNGDGYDDVIVGAFRADDGSNEEGISYVVYGKIRGFGDVDLSSLSSSDGFRIVGEDTNDRSGHSVSSAGDVNGDGYDDVIIGANKAGEGGKSNNGISYVVFGKASGFSEVNLASLSTDGFKIKGEDSDDNSGYSVSGAGDVNGDGYDDLIIGAPFAEEGSDNQGISYVVFGKSSNFNDLNLGDVFSFTNIDGFKIIGEAGGDESGTSVSSAGDINGDGYDDLIVGAHNAEGRGSDNAQGISYVIYGRDFSEEETVLTGRGTFSGTVAMENIVGSNDVDEITIGSGDRLNAGAGDDVIKVTGTDFSYVDGGTGTDVLKFEGTGLNLKLTSLPQMENIEILDITGSGDNYLGISEAVLFRSVGGFGEGGNFRLLIRGDAGDSVGIDRKWQAGTINYNGDNYQLYQQGAYQLMVDSAISVKLLDVKLGGADSLKIIGEDSGDQSGYSVSGIGDFNGDGYDDVIIGARKAEETSSSIDEGISYVVFGNANGYFYEDLDLGNLGTNGLKIVGHYGGSSSGYGDESGTSVSGAGDINGDGYADVIIGAPEAELAYASTGQGKSYVVFGGSNVADLDLESLGTNGFTIVGEKGGSSSGNEDYSGTSVSSAGDINGDGYDDIIVGAPKAEESGNSNEGISYVIFGKSSTFSDINLASLASSDGFKIVGEDDGDYNGTDVSGVGDINGDGYEDIIVGADRAEEGSDSSQGISYVIYGKASLSNINLGSGESFKIIGEGRSNGAGRRVSGAGDVNGDGYDDIIVGARGAGGSKKGRSYVVFGSSTGVDVDLGSLGTKGFKIIGQSSFDELGTDVSGVGDVNGDGYDDVIVSTPGARGTRNEGESYVIYGKASGFGDVNPNRLSSSTGFKIIGEDANDKSGTSVSGAGDINGDGYDDIIVGADDADGNKGVSYVIYGTNLEGDVIVRTGSFSGTTGADKLVGSNQDDTIDTRGGADSVNAGAGDDVIKITGTDFLRIDGGSGFDTLELKGNGINLDLTSLGNSKIENIESINLEGNGNNSLKLTALELIHLGGLVEFGRTKLIIEGNSGDSVTTTDDWTANNTAAYDGKSYNLFELGSYQLLIDTAVTTTGIM